MVRACPECDENLVDVDPAAEMGSVAKRYECRECALRFASDGSGTLFEVDA